VLDYGSERYEYTYDGTNMMKYLASDTGLARTFLYSADDERVVQLDCETAGCGVEDAKHTWTLRGTGARVLRSYTHVPGSDWTWENDYVHRGAKTIASLSAGGVLQLHPDHLGTPRQITRSTGAQESLHGYYPFGQEATGAAQDNIPLKFTGHERDFNDNRPKGAVDYMHARHCSPNVGRFLSVDPTGSPRSRYPQSWNKYIYSEGNPLKYIDPDGRTIRISTSNESENIRLFLVRTLMRAGGREKIIALANDRSFTVTFRDDRINSQAAIVVAMNRKSNRNLQFGATTPANFVVNGQESRGATINIDTKAVQMAHKDRTGVTTTAHESFHAVGVQQGLPQDELQAQDEPTNERGPAGQFGDSVAEEEPDLSEQQAGELLDDLLKGQAE
jgi:RHS repeat-associated protein